MPSGRRRFLANLAACQSLEELSLHIGHSGLHILSAADSRRRGAGLAPTIALPNLRVAEILTCADDADIILDVLSHIHFSPYCNVAIRCLNSFPELGSAALLIPNNPTSNCLARAPRSTPAIPHTREYDSEPLVSLVSPPSCEFKSIKCAVGRE